MALPVWSCNLEDGGRWVGMPEPMSTSEEEGSESEEEEKEEVKFPAKKEGKKRAAEESEEAEKPAKKAKASAAAKEVSGLPLHPTWRFSYHFRCST